MSRSNLVYVAPQEEDYCLVVDYPAIGVHAVCQEDTLWKRPCIYCQICDPSDEGTEDVGVVCGDEAFEAFDQEDNAEEEVEEEEDDGSIFEILFSPLDSGKSNLFDGVFTHS